MQTQPKVPEKIDPERPVLHATSRVKQARFAESGHPAVEGAGLRLDLHCILDGPLSTSSGAQLREGSSACLESFLTPTSLIREGGLVQANCEHRFSG